MNHDLAIWAEGLDHPESVATDIRGGIYTGGEAGQIYRIAADGTPDQIGSTGGFVLGLALDADDNIYLCDLARRELLRWEASSGLVTTVSNGSEERPFRTPNYPAFAPDGTLFVTDSGGWLDNDGSIFVVRPGHRTTLWSTAASGFPNACAVTPAGDALFLVESTRPGLTRIAINADGTAGAVDHVVTFHDDFVPDGLALCEDGSVLVSCYRPDVILKVHMDGAVDELVRDPRGTLLAAPTDLAFGGEDRLSLVVSNFGRWHLSRGNVGLRGALPHYPRFIG